MDQDQTKPKPKKAKPAKKSKTYIEEDDFEQIVAETVDGCMDENSRHSYIQNDIALAATSTISWICLVFDNGHRFHCHHQV